MSFFNAQNPGIGGLDEVTIAEGVALQTIAALGSPLQILRTNAGGTAVEWAAAGAGSGTVTSVSVTTAAGVSGSVATATTTPAITITLGAITPTSVNGLTITTTTGTLTVTNAKTLSVSNTLTLAGTDSTVMTFPATSATIARTDAANTFTGIQTFSTPIATGSVATMSATVGGGVPTPPNNTTTFLRGDGTFATPSGSGDMVLASAQTNTGAKTFNSNTFWDKGNQVFNVKAYGALGNDSADDTSAIQSAIAAAGAVGGVVWFPAGTYRLNTTALLLYNGSTPYSDITLAGAGANKAILKQMTTGVDVIKGLNNTTGTVQLLNVTIKDLKITFGGTTTNSGNGIYLAQVAADGPSFQQITIENVVISSMGATGKYGFRAESLIVSTIKNVMAVSCANGFYLNGGAFGGYDSINTSVSFIGCYANGTNTVIGYNILKSTYIAFVGCAADGNTTTAYLVDLSSGVSFSGCGAEWGTGASATAFKFTGSLQCSINGSYIYQGTGTTTNAIWATGSSTGINLTGIRYYQDAGTLTNGVLVDAGSSVVDNGCVWGPGAGTTTNTININATGIYKTPNTPRRTTQTSSATPTINVGACDIHTITAQTVDITSFTTNLTGTAVDGQKLSISITGTAARAITWGASFEASTVALPTTTVTTARLDVGFLWNAATSKWRCISAS